MANELAKYLLQFVAVPNVVAFGHVIKEGEVNVAPGVAHSDAAYGIINLGAHAPPITDFRDHPYRGLSTNAGGFAAGAYQAIPSTWEDFIRDCGERDFSKASQDLFLVYRLNYRKALDDVLAGRLYEATIKCRKEWTSLPGGADNSGKYTMEKVHAVFAEYGGTVAATQPAAPIEERPAIVGETGPETIQLPKGATIMPAGPTPTATPSAIDSIAGVVSLINPAAGGIIGLAGKLLEMFKPGVVAKLNQQIGMERTDVTSEAVALVSQAQALTKKPDAFDAVAAVRADPAILAQIEDNTEARMDALIKAADRSVDYDQAMWGAQIAGRQAASSVAIEEHRAGLWDMTETLVNTSAGIAAGGSVLLLIAIVYQSIWKTIDPVLLALAGPLLALTFGTIKDILAYRFDGTKESSAQTTALLNAAKDKKIMKFFNSFGGTMAVLFGSFAAALLLIVSAAVVNGQTLSVPLPAGCVPALNGFTVGCASGPVTPPPTNPPPSGGGGLAACTAAGYTPRLVDISYPLNAAGTAGQNYRYFTATSGPTFGNGEALILHFITPAHDPTTTATFTINYSGGAPQVNRVAALAVTPCIFPSVYSLQLPAAAASQAVTFNTSLTTMPQQWTTVLAPSTHYYITVVNRNGFGGAPSCTATNCPVYIDSN